MALRQGGRALARSLMQAKSLPTRGGGGGPIRYADAPNKQVCVLLCLVLTANACCLLFYLQILMLFAIHFRAYSR